MTLFVDQSIDCTYLATTLKCYMHALTNNIYVLNNYIMFLFLLLCFINESFHATDNCHNITVIMYTYHIKLYMHGLIWSSRIRTMHVNWYNGVGPQQLPHRTTYLLQILSCLGLTSIFISSTGPAVSMISPAENWLTSFTHLLQMHPSSCIFSWSMALLKLIRALSTCPGMPITEVLLSHVIAGWSAIISTHATV